MLLLTFLILMNQAAMADLSKREAYTLLKNNSYRWHQTEQLTIESEGLKKQAAAADRFHLGFVSREYVARINQLQFGFQSPGPLDLISLGATTLQASYALIDKASLARLEAAKQNEKMSLENQKQFQSDLTYFMLITFLNAQRLQKKNEMIDENIKRDSDILNISQTRLRIGHGLKVDILRAKVLFEKDNLKKLEVKSSSYKAKQDLASLLGQESIDVRLEPLEVHTLITPQTPKALETNLKSRADIKSAYLMWEVTKNLKLQAEKETSPKLNLGMESGIFGSHALGGIGSALTGSVGLQLSFPILDGGYFSGKVQEMSAKNMTAEYQIHQVELDARNQIKQACNQLEDARAALETSRTLGRSAEEELRLIRLKFVAGSSSGLELASAHANASTAQDLEIDAMFGYELAKLNYYKSTGSYEEYLR